MLRTRNLAIASSASLKSSDLKVSAAFAGTRAGDRQVKSFCKQRASTGLTIFNGKTT
ncbi:MAG: hypothetical protein HC910_08610 [Spirulinaceae cyanobacterium SM2_1_0]|nr:hypothetical protein [Spirulinaceae cyanobacterium SM2_1_0]